VSHNKTVLPQNLRPREIALILIPFSCDEHFFFYILNLRPQAMDKPSTFSYTWPITNFDQHGPSFSLSSPEFSPENNSDLKLQIRAFFSNKEVVKDTIYIGLIAKFPKSIKLCSKYHISVLKNDDTKGPSRSML
jgi:hypothetical protein